MEAKVVNKLFLDLYSNNMRHLIPDGVKLVNLVDFKKEQEKRKLKEELKKTSLGRELF